MANVSIFVPHNGCPHKCSFCEQRHITGCATQPDAEAVTKAITTALVSLKEKSKEAEIAFFGGSFTAIDRDYMIYLLSSTEDYIHHFKGIRVSTRPDAIDSEVLNLLKKYKVTSIELGAQSMSDTVLKANSRGHSAQDVINASQLIKKHGFSLGLQMMTGLYKSTTQDDIFTANEFIRLKPDTVRIYPTVVLKNTELYERYSKGEYIVPDVEESVNLCAKLIPMFEENHIKIIRVGLHASHTLEGSMVAGAYHPAFRELCESKIYADIILKTIHNLNINKGRITVFVPYKDLSKAIGQKGANKQYFKDLGYDITFIQDNTLSNRRVLIKEG